MKTKCDLTRTEKRTDSANAERLKLAGVAIDIEHAASAEPPLLRVEQSEDSDLYAGTLGGMALAICLRFTTGKSEVTPLDVLDITLPGCDDSEIFLVQPPEKSLSYKVFRWLDIHRDVVLNHQIFNGRPLPGGRIFDGFLVAQSFAGLPSQFLTGMLVSAQIRFADQSGNVFPSEVRLGVMRCVQDRLRPEERHIRAGASYRHSSSPQAQEPRSRVSKQMDGIAPVQRGEPAIRSPR